MKWPALEQHREIARLSFFHKIIHNLSPVDLPSYFNTTNRTTCQCHPLHMYMIVPYTATSAYQGNFFPRTITDWNILPIPLI